MTLDSIAIILFNEFETLDVMGPVEVFGRLDNCKINFISPSGLPMTSSQGVTLETIRVDKPRYKHILIPGGQGTRPLSQDDRYIQWLMKQFEFADTVISVCTGSALIAKTPLLNGLRATTNKLAYDWVTSLNKKFYGNLVQDGCMTENFIPLQVLVPVLICRCKLLMISMG
ncbi:MAG: DJ-1/PfpI family protein [Providencia rettgeri]|uniref:DJ-1/PfpI family protein n=1 Tax=unclassified Providencia TaxID=2633465 RepID=UPI00234BB673|nr:DJ-1/PfpI family protein [Providencia sp. PROV164]